MADLKEYDEFITQFERSIDKLNTTGKGQWFGRLLRNKGDQEWKIYDFFGENYGEEEFREKLKNGSIKIHRFDVKSFHYNPLPTAGVEPVELVTLRAKIYVSATIDEKSVEGDYEYTFLLKRAYQTYETRIKPA